MQTLKFFIAPITVSVIALAIVGWWGGLGAFLLATMLAVLEVTLSFDNAVVNAKVLKEMSAVWQRRFLTWGILLSVVGTRLILPIIIVSIVAFMSPFAITMLAFTDPAEYTRLLLGADGSIKAFGGAFLLMVALKFFVDAGKTVHWIAAIEKRIAKWGNIEAIEAALVMLVLVVLSFFSHDSAATILRSGIVGIVLFTVTEGVANGLNIESKHVVRSGGVLFLYLNLLDTAFSLDGVIGAFALTTSLPIIVVGLGIGAYFVRSLTVYLVRAKTLDTLIYLEHGAHWAILGLAGAMFAGLVVHVPEIFTASIGIAFILLSYYSSRREIKAH
ncbi:hypothetical protein A2419_03425 [Candidatus Adlerbacteria bacterium RIFOXYC1_FULL_48_26]|uniref:DUF475 domain-containing protein n=1 Tax=Candidatus Adlerbacteria bacterium RIFOXYC1_FULL_48_26 TaxID=1797247 RepID=A0A1F4Y465_9BACT|nr:MAG: hypothetical protein A2419_03425 [Candidatus Adlerbacteria bacterium RIFOXYC1_FULL_48_26]OGC94357.1 MAG: hypothetical protein A2389_01215 [Candidatus Adlerbacteria bacterium RIFOXYB1_FULL_48_10]OGC96380.1 MAG: hypothetical protein A2590_02110 [Candidatus Adlerbacteria bacterium RIFOXYD1_FULL_48_8]